MIDQKTKNLQRNRVERIGRDQEIENALVRKIVSDQGQKTEKIKNAVFRDQIQPTSESVRRTSGGDRRRILPDSHR